MVVAAATVIVMVVYYSIYIILLYYLYYFIILKTKIKLLILCFLEGGENKINKLLTPYGVNN